MLNPAVTDQHQESTTSNDPQSQSKTCKQDMIVTIHCISWLAEKEHEIDRFTELVQVHMH